MNIVWVQLIAQVGLDVAYKIWQHYSSGAELTDEMWQSLLVIARKKADSYLTDIGVTPPQ